MQNKNFIYYANKYGIPLGLFLVVYSLLMYLLSLDKETWTNYLIYLFYLVAMIIFIQQEKKSNDGYITFGTAFKTAFIPVIVATIISLIYFVIHTQFIDTSFYELLLEKEKEKLYKQNLSEEQMAKAVESIKMFLNPTFIVSMALISQIIVSGILSAICAAVMKKE